MIKVGQQPGAKAGAKPGAKAGAGAKKSKKGEVAKTVELL